MADISDPARGILPAGAASVEARFGSAFRALLHGSGWAADEPWTPLSRDLTEQMEGCGIRVDVVDPHSANPSSVSDRVAVQLAAFPGSAFTVERWSTMAAASRYRRARCLVAYAANGAAVAAVTVWSAGQGRPGLLEPVGVHRLSPRQLSPCQPRVGTAGGQG